ncbi:O-antigen polymerase [Peribacillus loiseleuriae]|uniref:Oligosaccharide repeat unit polymerase n=1 Tax=Peribacillus loiseleuriae TaxID=1679170 RepID=A0A0K9GWM1_9BACI|nr:O-antigen polymerase [Peribacillus loiseleuriae]KMY51040.1 hypothetical protein AC625_17145 [Peribacillus loiseleuriae]
MILLITLCVVIILFVIFLKITISISKKIYGVSLNPLSIFTFIWLFIVGIYILPLNIFYPLTGYGLTAIGLGYLSFFGGCLQVGLLKTKVTKSSGSTDYLFPQYMNEPILRKFLYFALLCRIGQIVISLNTMLKIAGSFSVLINNSTYVRNIYLSRSDIPDFSLIGRVFPVLLNLVAGVGIIVAAIYLFVKGRKILLPIMLLLSSPLLSLILMSKQAAIIDGLLFFWTFVICFVAYKYKISKVKESIKLNININVTKRKSIFKLILGLLILLVLLLNLIALQRGYSEQESPIPMLPKTVAQAIIYGLGPLEGLNVLVSNYENEMSHGARTFRPLVKWLISFNILDASILPPFFDSMIQGKIGSINVYTWLGMFYKDFGYAGIIILPYFMGLFSSFAFKKALFKPTIFWIGSAALLGTIILFSFYNWLAQETYYLILPFILLLLEIFLMQIMKGSKSKSLK